MLLRLSNDFQINKTTPFNQGTILPMLHLSFRLFLLGCIPMSRNFRKDILSFVSAHLERKEAFLYIGRLLSQLPRVEGLYPFKSALFFNVCIT